MTEADVIQPSASIASTGPGIRYIGQHCYAYSGLLAGATASETTYLEFQTGAGFIQGEFAVGSTNETTRKKVYIYFNGVNVLTQDIDNNYPWPNKFNFIIPPLTRVQVTLKLNGDEGMSSWFTFCGRVYDA